MKYYKLHLIRHGLTQGNLDGRYIGSGTDLPLCAEGRAQLEELKAKFQYPDVPLVFCSPCCAPSKQRKCCSPTPSSRFCRTCGR